MEVRYGGVDTGMPLDNLMVGYKPVDIQPAGESFQINNLSTRGDVDGS